MEDLLTITGHFEAISLEEMDSVKLLNRVDTKYVFNAARLPGLLHELETDYRILEIESVRLNHYETLYYDTPDLQLYRQHHNGKLNRYKIRCRKYAESGLGFFEIKFKNNHGRTIKSRVKNDLFTGEIAAKPLQLLEKKLPGIAGQLIPTLQVYFTRMTLVNRNLTERITLDTGLWYHAKQEDRHYPMLAIAEVKQGCNGHSEVHDLMRRHHIFPSGMSKYCIGICSMNFPVKKNNFKGKLLKINKIHHECL